MAGFNKTNTPAEKQPSRGKQAAVALLGGGAVLYLCIFGGIYLWSSGFDLKAFLFRDKDDAAQAPTLKAEKKEHTADAPHPGENNNLLPLDDGPNDEALFPPALPTAVPTNPPAEAENSSAARTAAASSVSGVSFVSRLTPVKCWDARGFEHNASTCDSPVEFLRAAKQNLSAWESCRSDISGALNTGTITFFAEADFIRNMVSVWPADTTGVRAVGRIVECINEKWRKIPLTAGPRRFSRYRLKGSIRFENPRRAAAEKTVGAPPSVRIEHLEKIATDAEEVQVVKDRIRVRKAPVDGEVIGFISTGQRVKLLQVSDEWCLVKTKRGNVGWMICWGLELREKSKESPPPEDK